MLQPGSSGPDPDRSGPSAVLEVPSGIGEGGSASLRQTRGPVFSPFSHVTGVSADGARLARRDEHLEGGRQSPRMRRCPPMRSKRRRVGSVNRHIIADDTRENHSLEPRPVYHGNEFGPDADPVTLCGGEAL